MTDTRERDRVWVEEVGEDAVLIHGIREDDPDCAPTRRQRPWRSGTGAKFGKN